MQLYVLFASVYEIIGGGDEGTTDIQVVSYLWCLLDQEVSLRAFKQAILLKGIVFDPWAKAA